MIYALVHYPNIDTKRIDELRVKYDPQIRLIEPHLTLMFPVPKPIGEGNLVRHLESVLRGWQPFLVHLRGLQVSLDDHLFLLIQEGNTDILRLHDEIYTGLLTDYHRKDIPFVPHLTLGVLNRDPNEDTRVLEEAKQLNLDYYCMLDRLHLVKINDDRSEILWRKEFILAQ